MANTPDTTMKYETALKILEDRAQNFYGLEFDAYLDLICRCGMTAREDAAYARWFQEQKSRTIIVIRRDAECPDCDDSGWVSEDERCTCEAA